MQSMDEIKKQINNVKNANNDVYKSKEIKELPNILDDREVIEDLIKANYLGDGTILALPGYLFATNIRLIFIRKSFLKSQVEDFYYNKTNSIWIKNGFPTEIVVNAHGHDFIIRCVNKDNLDNFVRNVRERIFEVNNTTKSNIQNNFYYGDVVDTQIQDSVIVKSNIGKGANECSKCGNDIGNSQNFCSSCGTKLT